MIIKPFVAFLFLFITSSNGLIYKYSTLAGGWLKWHQKADYTDAYILCESEGAVLVSPLTSQIRDAVRHYLKREGKSTDIMSGVRATYSDSDYLSVEGVNLLKMPVMVESSMSSDLDSSQSCVKWMTNKDSVMNEKCDTMLPFVCFKKRLTVTVAGCKTTADGYQYNERSGSCYKFHKKGMTWTNAFLKCKSEGGYLAVSNSKLENKVLNDFFNMYSSSITSSTEFDRAFVGIRDYGEGESWKTVKGQTLEEAGFTGWAPGEPNNLGGNEQCVSLFRDGTYNDDRCDMSLIFICEADPDILYENKSG